jgi:hypothetical protein
MLVSRIAIGILLLTVSIGKSIAQVDEYWQQSLRYKIESQLFPSNKSLTGNIQIQYSNRSPETLHFIWLHLWPNAYKNDRTAFSEQLLENGRTDFYFAEDDKRGYINQLNFKIDLQPIQTVQHPIHPDIVQLVLNRPLLPGDSLLIQTPFHLKLPALFSRLGYQDGMFHLTQWYPKPAVYDKNGWHPMPYLDQGEFYSEWGDYDVRIRIPRSFEIAASGDLIDTMIHEDQTKTWHFQQERIHDFAWFADSNWIVEKDTLMQVEKQVDIYFYHRKKSVYRKINLLDLAKRSLHQKINQVGPYPYNNLKLIQSSRNEGGGMEYPMIALFDPSTDLEELQSVVHHEIGHQWFYGLMGSNERKHPWMDEGINSYYDQRFFPTKSESIPFRFIDKRFPRSWDNLIIQHLQAIHRDQPIETPANQLTAYNYQYISYLHTANWLKQLETKIGRDAFDRVMQAYYRNWIFKHPTPEDFKSILDSVTGSNHAQWFEQRLKGGPTDSIKPNKWKFRFLFDFNQSQTNRTFFWMPTAGFNTYDGMMPGLILHNHGLPPSRFQFYAMPLFSVRNKTIRGQAGMQYTRYGDGWGEKWNWKMKAAHFGMDKFQIDENPKILFSYRALNPSLTYQFGNRNPRSSFEHRLQWNSFFIQEENPVFKFDSTNNYLDVTRSTKSQWIHQLNYQLINSRTLYPYALQLMAEWGNPYTRLTATGNYHYQYPDGGGLKLRGFIGGFIYNRSVSSRERFESERYHLNLSGINGNEDYTYSHYFLGRNQFEGWMLQQMAIRDGGFRIRTDLLNQKIGKSDQWLTAINATTTIPKILNPFREWNFNNPLRIFLDVGTTNDIWNNEAGEPKILYNSGIQISLFNEVLNVYLPIAYSKPFRDYVNSVLPQPSWSHRISFSLDLNKLNRKTFNPGFPLE